ncbi:MAG: hypothetical protein NW206_09745 [Hyphomonadaceae bacterium]|nr:hypothetical protein [Hyphomonadaceae bacterium]
MFIRSASRPFGRHLPRGVARGLVIALYTLYPIGCALQLVPDDNTASAALSITGLALVVAAIAAFVLLAGSSLQRQAQEEEAKLDERELAERNRAAYGAHAVFSGIVLLGVIYLMLSQDLVSSGKLSLWTPTAFEHWNALFWGFTMLALTLPAAFLAFQKSDPDLEPNE